MRRHMIWLFLMICITPAIAIGQDISMPEQVEYNGQVFVHAEGWGEYEEIRYADIDGDARDEIVMRIKTYTKDDFPGSFTLIYDEEDGKYSLKETFLTGETPKSMNLADINNDGIQDIILYDHSGNHYTQIRIFSYQDGTYKCLFENGTACYVHDVKTDLIPPRIVIGRENWEDKEFCYANSDTRSLLEVWSWNGEEFEYSTEHSTVRMIPEIEAIQITADNILGKTEEIGREIGNKDGKASGGFKNENVIKGWISGYRFMELEYRWFKDFFRRVFGRDRNDVGYFELTTDMKTVVYVKHVKEKPWNQDTGWMPSDFDEIWIRDIETGKERQLIGNNFNEVKENKDWDNYLGSFDSIYISPDGQKVYFLCQNSTSNAVLFMSDINGENIKRIRGAHQLNMVGGSDEDEYYGFLVAGVKALEPSDKPNECTSVLFDPNGNMVKEIEDIDSFWNKHVKE